MCALICHTPGVWSAARMRDLFTPQFHGSCMYLYALPISPLCLGYFMFGKYEIHFILD